MKKITAFTLCLCLMAGLFAACVSIENLDGISVESPSKPAESSAEAVESSEEAPSVAPEPSSTEEEPSSADPVYAPVYPEGYDERVTYYSNMKLTADVDDIFFNDSVFVGNSVMLHFKNYVTSNRAIVPDLLGNSQFFAAASFSFYNNKHQNPTDEDCALPVLMGENMNIKQAVEKLGAKTVYLSLMALNDIALYKDGATGIAETYTLFTELVEDLKQSFPETAVVVMGNTYLHKNSNGMQKLNNRNVNELNRKVLDYCNAKGLDFIEVGEVLLDADNCLGTEFCSDVGADVACHLNSNAYNAWMEILRDYAAKKNAGTWANPTELKNLA